MAKISAHGDTERARYRHAGTGAELVLTTRGRLLSKPVKGGSFTLQGNLSGYPDHGFEEARRRAEQRGMVKV